MSDKTPTWGYARGDKAEIFHLAAGEKLPEGYFAHPAMIKGSPAAKRHEAEAEKEGATSQFKQGDA